MRGTEREGEEIWTVVTRWEDGDAGQRRVKKN